MKKLLCTVLAACFIMALCGCNNKNTSSFVSDTGSVNTDVSSADTVVTDQSSNDETSLVPDTTSAASAGDSQPQPDNTEAAKPDIPQNIPESGVPFIKADYTDEQLMQLDNTKNGYGLGLNKDADNRPTGATGAQQKYGKYGAVFIAPKSEYVFLTFDLGYENGYTSKILDTLAEKNAKGIFFVTMEYCKSSPDIVKRIIDEGHVLGNHSVHHKSMPTLNVEQMREEITGMHDYIKEKYGYEMFLFRPPMGEYSERSLAVAQSLGYQTMNWSFAYKDWDTAKQPDPTFAKNKMINDAHGGAVYLIHAVSKTNASVLGSVIDGIREKGFVTAKYVKIEA